VNWLTPARRNWLLLALKLLIVALVAWCVRGTVLDAVARLGEYWRRLAPGWLLAAGGLYLLGLLPEGLFWHRVLRALGQDVRLGPTLRAYFIGHLGKYVPGKAMVVVLRAGLLRGRQLDTGLVIASVFLETLTMMAVGACLAIPILATWFSSDPRLLAAAIALTVVAGLPTLPPVFCRLARLLGVARSSPQAAERLARLRYRTLAGGWLAMTAGWLLMGASLWAVLRGMGIAAGPPEELLLDTAAVALAVVGGFVSMIPGGLLAREAVLAALLGGQLGGAAAIIVAALLRLVWLVAELAISAMLYAVGKRD